MTDASDNKHGNLVEGHMLDEAVRYFIKIEAGFGTFL